MTNPLLQSQLDRFDEKFGPIWTLWNTVVAKFAGTEQTIDTSPELAIKGFIEDCDKERLMWVVELIASRKVETLGCQCDYPCVDDCFCMCHEYFAANVALEEILSLIKKEIGVTE